MHYLKTPNDKAGAILAACVESYHDKYLKFRLSNASKLFSDNELLYISAGNEKVIYSLSNAINDYNLSAGEFISLYDDKLSNKRCAARVFYDYIKNGAKAGKCPLCGHRDVYGLDHYLPKTVFPAFSITPANLVPACSDCNHIKSNLISKNSYEQLVHPYFDDVEQIPWLVGTVTQSFPPVVEFNAVPEEPCDKTMAARIRYHFQAFKLGELYSKQAATELSLIEGQMIKLRESGGTQLVLAHLIDAWESRRSYRLNAWQTAFYRALADSLWYCETIGHSVI